MPKYQFPMAAPKKAEKKPSKKGKKKADKKGKKEVIGKKGLM